MSSWQVVPDRDQATPTQWRTLVAATAGWMLDAMDVMFYAFALVMIRNEFNLSGATAGSLAAVALLTSAVGGIVFGIVADRYGRVRALIWSILVYSCFTALTATAHSLATLILWRCLVGIGLGGEWAAGSVLVAESWSPEHRGKAIGLMQSGWAIGYIAAAVLASLILPRFGWRTLFLVGLLPALLTIWIRRSVPEPELWRRTQGVPRVKLSQLFRPPLRRRAVLATALATTVLFAYWGLFTWIPAYLASPLAQGGAEQSLSRSTLWIVLMQIGAFAGYVSFGVFADRFGRKPVFVTFVLGAALLVPAYAGLASRPNVLFALVPLIVIGPLVGFFGHGYFSVFGAMLAELFPTAIRGAAQGMCYNLGRAISALAPALIGALADRFGIGSALATTAAFFLAAVFLVLPLPETRGSVLE
jgi:MFS family permease